LQRLFEAQQREATAAGRMTVQQQARHWSERMAALKQLVPAKPEWEPAKLLEEERRREIEAEIITRAAAEHVAKREAAKREARRRRRAAKRRRAAERQATAEREAAEREAAEREAAEREVAEWKPQQGQHKKDDVERVRMTQSDIEWATEALRNDIENGFSALKAAYSLFEDRWGKHPDRKKRRVPGRTQFSRKIWSSRCRPLSSSEQLSEQTELD
jgi:hypothetical protein